MKQLKKYIDANRQRFIDELVEYLRFVLIVLEGHTTSSPTIEIHDITKFGECS